MKKYIIKNVRYEFDAEKLKEVIQEYKTKNNLKSLCEVQEKLSEFLHVAISTIHSWYSKVNSPSYLDLIKEIAKFFDINYVELLKKIKTNNIDKQQNSNLDELNEQQIKSLKRIYDAIIDFLVEFKNSSGFTDLWYEYLDKGYNEQKIINLINNYTDTKINQINQIILKEYFYLHNTKVYEYIQEYVDIDLVDTYNEKLKLSYRTSADCAGEGISTVADYDKALNRINDIILKVVKFS